MKVQLRRWFAIGLTSGALAVSMLAGSGAVGAAAADSQGPRNNFEQRGSFADTIAAPSQIVTFTPSVVASPISASDFLQNREIRD